MHQIQRFDFYQSNVLGQNFFLLKEINTIIQD